MDKKYLIINIGSTSKKYALYSDKELFFINLNEDVELILKLLISKNLIVNKNEISGIGIRIVAPGDYFLDNKFINFKNHQSFCILICRCRQLIYNLSGFKLFLSY